MLKRIAWHLGLVVVLVARLLSASLLGFDAGKVVALVAVMALAAGKVFGLLGGADIDDDV